MKSLIHSCLLESSEVSKLFGDKRVTVVDGPGEGHWLVEWEGELSEVEVWERIDFLKELVESGKVLGSVSYEGDAEDLGILMYWEGTFVDGAIQGVVATQMSSVLVGEVLVGAEAWAFYEVGEKEVSYRVTREDSVAILNEFMQGEGSGQIHVYGEAGMGKSTLLDSYFGGLSGCFRINFDIGGAGVSRWWEEWMSGGERSLEEMVSRLDEGLRRKGVAVIVIDNLQWIDQQSLRMLRILLEVRNEGLRVATFSREELTSRLELCGEGRTVCHTLRSFDVEQVARLIEARGDGLVNVNERSSEVMLYSGGHPLLVEELVENQGILRQLHDRAIGVGGADEKMGRYEVLAATIFQRNPSLNELGGGDLRKLVRVLAEGRSDYSVRAISKVIDLLKLNVRSEDFFGLGFVREIRGGEAFGFKHDFHRHCILATVPEESGSMMGAALAEAVEIDGDYGEAARLWERSGLKSKAVAALLKACRRGESTKDYGRLGKWASKGVEQSSEGGADEDLMEFLWYSGQSAVHAGALADAAEHMKRYLGMGKCWPRKRWLWLYGIFFVKTSWRAVWAKKIMARNEEENRKVVLAYAAVIEYLGIAGSPMETLKYLMGFYMVASWRDENGRSLSEIYGLLAIVFSPVLGSKGVRRFHLESLVLARREGRSEGYTARFLRYHLRMHGVRWKEECAAGKRMVEGSLKARQFVNSAKLCMEYVVCLLCLDRHEEAEDFMDSFLDVHGAYVPDWIGGWFGAVRLGIWVDTCSPARVLMMREEGMEDELQAGKHLYYGVAEMGMDNVEKAKKHYLAAMSVKEQVRVNHHAFTLCLAPFCELRMYLFLKGEISLQLFKSSRKMMKTHGRFVYRSRSLVLGYLALEDLFFGDVQRGLKRLREAQESAAERGELRPSRYLTMHLEYTTGEVGPVPSSREGMGERVARLWGSLNEERRATILEASSSSGIR